MAVQFADLLRRATMRGGETRTRRRAHTLPAVASVAASADPRAPERAGRHRVQPARRHATAAPLLTLPARPVGRFHHAMQRLASSGAMPWVNARLLRHLDRALLRLSGGRWTASGHLARLPVLALTTTGARSGRPRRTLLVGLPDGEAIVVIASNWGEKNHPAWYHNLRAHPAATLTVGGRTRRVVAREAAPAERARLWALGDAAYLGYAAYRRRAGARRIPIMILTAAEEEQSGPPPAADIVE